MSVVTKVAFLGPEGTFTHQAVSLVRVGASERTLHPCSTVVGVIQAVEDGIADIGVVPIENSVEGQVNLTVDVLVHDAERVQVQEEVVLDVTFGAYRHPDDNAIPTEVASHPVGLAQCRSWAHDVGLTLGETNSTAEACRLVSLGQNPGLLAVASPIAAQRWGLVPVEVGVEDFPGAQTRFLVVGASPSPPPSGVDRTMFVLVPPHEQVGVLLTVLQELSGRGLNLSSIASRPLRVRLGEYCFVLVVDAHQEDERTAAAFAALRAAGHNIKVLGSYPQWVAE